jgi:FMN phosphatase YigB (HAD superfamily)
MRVHPLAPVVALDIDGTLGDYHSHFQWFAELYLQEPITLDWAWSWNHYHGEFSEALGLHKDVYRQIKLAYRQGGMKRCMPAFPQSHEVVKYLRERMGLQVWICTTRPWNRLDNIDPDTQFWIQRNLGPVDGVIYGEEKYKDLIEIVGRDRIVCVVDDLVENVEQAIELGLDAAVRVNASNADSKDDYYGVNSSEDIQRWVEQVVEDKQLNIPRSEFE